MEELQAFTQLGREANLQYWRWAAIPKAISRRGSCVICGIEVCGAGRQGVPWLRDRTGCWRIHLSSF